MAVRGLTGWIGTALSSPTPESLARFYADLLGWEISSSAPEWATIQVPGARANLAFALDEAYERPVWPSAPGRQQMMGHLDIGVSDVAAAVHDALELGAELAAYQPQDDVRVMLDPDGHPFCLYVDND